MGIAYKKVYSNVLAKLGRICIIYGRLLLFILFIRKDMRMVKTDKIDQAILNELQNDGKLSNVDLADRVGLSESACLRRVKRLENDGVIDRYTAIVNADKVGLGGTIFVRISLDSQKEENLKRFEDSVKHVDEVMECYLMSGDVDYIIRLAVRDAVDYERIHHVLTSLPEVARVHSSFSLRTVLKRTRVPIKK